MSWRGKLLIVFVVLWAMGTINERLGDDLDPVSKNPTQQERQCTEDELLDTRSMTCIHVERS